MMDEKNYMNNDTCNKQRLTPQLITAALETLPVK